MPISAVVGSHRPALQSSFGVSQISAVSFNNTGCSEWRCRPCNANCPCFCTALYFSAEEKSLAGFARGATLPLLLYCALECGALSFQCAVLCSSLQDKEIFTVQVLDVNQGGLICRCQSLQAFIPISQLNRERDSWLSTEVRLHCLHCLLWPPTSVPKLLKTSFLDASFKGFFTQP